MKKAGRAGFARAFVLLLTISLFASVAFAGEKLDLCPAGFNIDNSSWAMIWVGTDIVPDSHYTVYTRKFTFFPDVNLYIFVGLKKLWNPDCLAILYSYGSPDREGERRVWGIIDSLGSVTYYLFLPDTGWKRGDNVLLFPDCDTAEDCNLVFTLYSKGIPIASRVVAIK